MRIEEYTDYVVTRMRQHRSSLGVGERAAQEQKTAFIKELVGIAGIDRFDETHLTGALMATSWMKGALTHLHDQGFLSHEAAALMLKMTCIHEDTFAELAKGS